MNNTNSPKGKRQARNRDHIMMCALKLLRKNGLASFSLRQVAKAADYSPAGLYEYFSSREELLSAVGAYIESQMYTSLSAAVTADPFQSLISLGKAYRDFALKNREDYLLVFTGFISARKSHSMKLDTGSAYLVVFQQVEKLAATAPEPPSRDQLESMTYGIWSLLHGQVMLQLTHLRDYQADFETTDQELLKIFLNGLFSE